jgi:uncharacterized membrane protein
MRVLIAGESWMSHTTHVKGFDSFTTSTYAEGAGPMREALATGGHDVTYLPNHVAPTAFPTSAEALRALDVVILSDIGVNTLLMPDSVFVRSQPMANRLTLLESWVREGGGLLMVGGYLTFQGIEAKGAYRGTAVERVLPVDLQAGDDRREHPEGVTPQVDAPDHPVVAGLSDWPAFLGYNRAAGLKPDAVLVASVDGDPFIAVREVGAGRSAVFASDCGPHWGPPPFLAWSGYGRLWNNLVEWLGKGA